MAAKQVGLSLSLSLSLSVCLRTQSPPSAQSGKLSVIKTFLAPSAHPLSSSQRGEKFLKPLQPELANSEPQPPPRHHAQLSTRSIGLNDVTFASGGFIHDFLSDSPMPSSLARSSSFNSRAASPAKFAPLTRQHSLARGARSL